MGRALLTRYVHALTHNKGRWERCNVNFYVGTVRQRLRSSCHRQNTMHCSPQGCAGRRRGPQQIQASENAGHTLLTVESDKQCMLRIAKATLIDGYSRKLVIPQISLDFPHLKNHVEGYSKFVESIGGGESPHFLDWKQKDSRFTTNKSHLRGTLLGTICEKIGHHAPKTMCALALAARTVPKEYVRKDDSRFVDWFTKADIDNASTSDKFPFAEQSLKDMQKHVNEIVKDAADALIFTGRADTRVARMLADKKSKSWREFSSLWEIFEELKVEVSEYVKSGRKTGRKSSEVALAKEKAEVSL
jgi:uncharacterized protein YdaT